MKPLTHEGIKFRKNIFLYDFLHDQVSSLGLKNVLIYSTQRII